MFCPYTIGYIYKNTFASRSYNFTIVLPTLILHTLLINIWNMVSKVFYGLKRIFQSYMG